MERLCYLFEVSQTHEAPKVLMSIKVLHISTARSWRGGEQQIAYLCTELRKLGLEQHIACIKGAPLHQWALKNQYPVLALKKASSLDLRFSGKLKRYSKKQDIQVWHAHDAHAHGFAVYAHHIFKAKAALIVSRRVDFPVARSRSSAFKYNHPSVSRYLCVSEAIANILRQSLEPNKSIFTVHSAIDPEKFKQAEAGKFRAEFAPVASKKWIGNVAALTGHKDLFTFLNTAAELLKRRNDLHFFIAGSGELDAELKAHAKELKLDDHLSFLGFRQDVVNLQTDLDIFLFTSEMEGLGTSVLDAFAAGTPVVTTNAGGIPEMVKHEKSGLIYPVKDVRALADGVERVLGEPDLGPHLVQGAKEILQEFLPSKMAEKTLQHYKASLVSKA